MILRFSFSVVKGNMNMVPRKMLLGTRSKGADTTKVEGDVDENHRRQLKYWLGFAFEQTWFPLGQVSHYRTG